MKKSLFFLISFLMIGMALFAQTSITLTFTGRDQHNAHVRLDNVTIQNLTRGWTEAIFFPDTVYTLTVGTGIEDYAQGNEMQVMPNPFNGKTQLNLYSVKGEPARMVIVDITGKKCAEYQGNLSQGDNYFEISLTTPQTYVLSVQTSDGVHSVKMVNTGRAGTNQISLVGGESNVAKVKISSSKSHVFELGDEMRYTGYSQQSNGLIPSAPITQQQSESEVITLNFEFEEAQVGIIGDTAVIFGQSATLTAFGCDTYLWSTGDTTATITVTPNRTTSYTVIGTIYDGRGTDSATHTVVVYPILPTVTTTTVNGISSTSAMCGGNISSDGGADITARGVCWATSTNPTVAGSHTTDGIGAGVFSSAMTGLVANTTYYVRAYATNIAGTAYGDEVTFITTGPAVFDCGTSLLYDYDGNTYNTVLIGTQCWMAENLRTTHFSDGTLIQEGTTASPYVSYRYTPNSDAINVPTYGYLYNQAAVIRGSVGGSQTNPSGVQGVCPTGWHVPSFAEWDQLFDTVESKPQYWCNNSSYYIGKALSSTSGWMSSTYTCAIGNNQASNNATGFGAKPAGTAFYDNYDFYGLGRYALYWCSDVTSSDYGYYITFEYDEGEPWRSSAYSSRGMSVRCLQDRLPVVTTAQVGSVTFITAVCGGNVTNSGASAIIDRGVCWSTSQNPTVADNVTHDGSGTGTFSSAITGLSEGTVYYVRAYATNAFGTSYGDEYRFVTRAMPPTGDNIPCPGMPTVTDFDNNVYNTVKIGNQCWMKENLRTTHYADGTLILLGGTTTSTTTGYRYYPGNSAANVSIYGYLYNWPAVVHGLVGSEDRPSGLQGICPNGWHVPSDAEWTELTDYVSSQPYYRCEGYPNSIARALASTYGWETTSGGCRIGSDTSTNNSTGFSAVPAGYSSNYYYMGSRACFWTATPSPEYSPDYSYDRQAFYRQLSYNSSEVEGTTVYYVYNLPSFSEGYSVRCVRDTVYLPTVTTGAVSDSSTNAAVCNGNVLYSGGANVIDKGFCWDTVPNPTLSSRNYSSVFTNNNLGVTNGPSASANTDNLGQETGFVASYDFLPGQGNSLSIRYANNEDYQNGVQTRSNSTSVSSGLGNFTYTILGLQPGTTYYLRAYATNALGTVYGNEVTFSTLPVPAGDVMPCPGAPTVTDYDGNVYNTVQIGSQCWMKENLRTTHFADGVAIPTVSNSDTSSIVPRRYNPGGNLNEYGYLYNFPAATHGHLGSSSNPSGLQGICPVGWHVPSAAEWAQLTNYVSGQNEYIFDQDATHIAKSLASQIGWSSGYSSNIIGNNAFKNNATGLGAMPAGYFTRYNSQFTCRNFGTHAMFWTSSGNSVYLYNDNAVPQNNTYSKYNGLSVRCVKGIGYNMPSVTTSAVHSITDTTAIVGGAVTQDGGDSLVERGICWNNTGAPTLQDQHVVCGTGTGTYSFTMTNLSDSVIYYVRAYATNQLGTVYGETKIFRKYVPIPAGDAQPCPGMATVTDVDGNVYNTVKIGAQCWTKENLRTTHYANGTVIAVGNTLSETMPYCYAPNDDINNVAAYGFLYNWAAVMNTASSQSNSHDICPNGWHVPSQEEWSELSDYVSSKAGYYYNYVYVAPLKALSSVYGWDSSSEEGSPGFDTLANNATGFNALPAGRKTNNYSGYGYTVSFWSKTEADGSDWWFDNTYAVAVTFYENSLSNQIPLGYTNKYNGCAVRCLKSTPPQVMTNSVVNVVNNSMMAEGSIVSDGGSPVTAYGFCWNTSPNPTLADSHIVISDTAFTGILQNLTDSTTYYVRAYATNSEGTAYGNEIEIFYTLCGNTITLDIDGNIYNTVKFGSQCWMKENLRTTRYSDGTGIALGSSTSYTTAYRYYPNGNSANVSIYGYLYNWKAVMGNSSSSSANPSGVQGICPTGWHVPSDAEWTQLTDYVSSQSQYVCGGDSTYIAKSLASTSGWRSSTNACAVGNNPVANNATGFSAFPAGLYNGNYNSFGGGAYFCSSTMRSGGGYVWALFLGFANANVPRLDYYTEYGFSVRCLRASGTATLPIVTTNTVSSITATSAICGGDVTNNGGDAVTARGVCWSDLPNPTVSNSHTTDGIGTGSFISSLTGLSANTTYYVRAYATNSAGTAYGSEVSFTTMNSDTMPDGQPCPGAATVTDIDNNTYNTVHIGSQCWMKENLRTTRYSDGTGIALGSSSSTTTPYRYYPNNASSNVSTYGYLYNWSAVMHGASSSSATPSGVQGICPNGWHVPSDAEWTQLVNYVGSQSQYQCNGSNTKIAKALASTTGWSSSTETCTVGNNPSSNNATGFSAFPVGYYYGYYGSFGNDAGFWSSTEDGSNRAWRRYLGYDDANVSRNGNNKGNGFSVRCVRD